MGLAYRLSRYGDKIEQIDVVKHTNYFVTIRYEKTAPGGKPTGETYDRREAVFTVYTTWKAAHVALINRINGRVASHQSHVLAAQALLNKIEKMKEPK